MQVHPHAHTWIPDGVFAPQKDGSLRFIQLDPPTDEDVDRLCGRIARRVRRLVEKTDNDQCAGNEDDDDEAAIAQLQADAVFAPINRRLRFCDNDADDKPKAPLTALCDGFSLHAGLHVGAGQRRKLEELLRYGSRPPFAQRRLSIRDDGKVCLKLRKPYYTGQTQLVLEPLAFLKRLFAIMPLPRWHLTRYHGIFSNRHHLRPDLKALVPNHQHVLPQILAPSDKVAEPQDMPAAKRPTYAQLLSRVFC